MLNWKSYVLLAMISSGAFAALNAAELSVGPDKEFKTIQSAVASLPRELPESVVIRIAPGTYREMVSISGIKTRPDRTLTLRGDGDPASVVIDAEKKRDHGVTLKKQHYVVLENLTILRAKGFGNLFLEESHKNIIRHCVSAFAGTALSDGILFSGSNENTVELCTLAGNGRAGAFLLNSSVKNRFRFNVISNNVIGISTSGKYPSNPLFVEFCDFFANRRTFVDVAPGAGNFFADPKFADLMKCKFTLKSNSPCPRWGAWGTADQKNPAAGSKKEKRK